MSTARCCAGPGLLSAQQIDPPPAPSRNYHRRSATRASFRAASTCRKRCVTPCHLQPQMAERSHAGMTAVSHSPGRRRRMLAHRLSANVCRAARLRFPDRTAGARRGARLPPFQATLLLGAGQVIAVRQGACDRRRRVSTGSSVGIAPARRDDGRENDDDRDGGCHQHDVEDTHARSFTFDGRCYRPVPVRCKLRA